MNILIVDNEEGFISMSKKLLAQKNHYVLTSMRGASVLETLKHMNIHVVVLNANMKDMNSLDVLRQIRSGFPLVQTIMIARSNMLNAVIEGLEFGALDYLIKPVDKQALIRKVEQALEERERLEERIRDTQIDILEKKFR